jgi:hypothetical protein
MNPAKNAVLGFVYNDALCEHPLRYVVFRAVSLEILPLLARRVIVCGSGAGISYNSALFNR